MCFGGLIGFWVLCLFVNLLLFVRMFFVLVGCCWFVLCVNSVVAPLLWSLKRVVCFLLFEVSMILLVLLVVCGWCWICVSLLVVGWVVGGYGWVVVWLGLWFG